MSNHALKRLKTLRSVKMSPGWQKWEYQAIRNELDSIIVIIEHEQCALDKLIDELQSKEKAQNNELKYVKQGLEDASDIIATLDRHNKELERRYHAVTEGICGVYRFMDIHRASKDVTIQVVATLNHVQEILDRGVRTAGLQPLYGADRRD